MKHGDKAKAKTAKASSKASVKKAVKNGATAQKSKAVKTAESGKSTKTVETGKGGSREAVAKAKIAGGNGRSVADPGGFSNAVVAAAFRRAVKKYPNAFRRLTD